MKILITGSAGFIGFHLSLKLLQKGNTVIGVDNLNNYYDVSLKKNRNKKLKKHKKYIFYKFDLKNKSGGGIDPVYVKTFLNSLGIAG